MDFTTHFLRAKGPCASGFRWYLRHQERLGGYQQVLDALVEGGRIEDACWLLDQFGPTHAVLDVEFLHADAVVFAGTIRARRGIEVGDLLRAGRSIECGGNIVSASHVMAGDQVCARGAVRAAGRLVAGGRLRAGGVIVEDELRTGGNLLSEGVVRCECLRACGDVAVRQDLEVAAVLRCAGSVRVNGSIVCGGAVDVRLGIECGDSLECVGPLDAGQGIRAGGSVIAGGAIRAGESLCAGGSLRAGPGYGVYAGTGVSMQDWATSGFVLASERPANLVSGLWSGVDALQIV